MVEKGTIPSEEVPLPMDPLAWQETQVDFSYFGNHLHQFELVPNSRKHGVPTEWQVRTVLGNCVTKARIISIQAPRYRQHALVSDFLDLANLSMRDEAVLATRIGSRTDLKD